MSKCSTEELRKRCGRNPNRVKVLTVLTKSPQALAPKDILTRLRKRHPFDKVTLYRTLELLARQNVVRRIPTLQGSTLYEVTCETHKPCHIHFICRDCGAIECRHDHALNALLREIQQRHGTDNELIDIKLEGRCRQCREATAKNTTKR